MELFSVPTSGQNVNLTCNISARADWHDIYFSPRGWTLLIWVTRWPFFSNAAHRTNFTFLAIWLGKECDCCSFSPTLQYCGLWWILQTCFWPHLGDTHFTCLSQDLTVLMMCFTSPAWGHLMYLCRRVFAVCVKNASEPSSLWVQTKCTIPSHFPGKLRKR